METNTARSVRDNVRNPSMSAFKLLDFSSEAELQTRKGKVTESSTKVLALFSLPIRVEVTYNDIGYNEPLLITPLIIAGPDTILSVNYCRI